MWALRTRCGPARRRRLKPSGPEVLVPFFCACYKPLMATIAITALAGAGIEVFFPQVGIEKLVRVRGHCPQLRVVYEPLFSGYLFVRRTDERAQSRLQNTRGIVGIVKFGDTPGIVGDHVIELLRAQQKYMLVPSKKARPMFTQGQVVEILRGPFAQRIAVVDRMTKEDRVRVLFSLFNAVTPIDVAVDNLKLTALRPGA